MAQLQQLGKYEIHEELGRGAFATVYRALDTTLNREVALKVLHPPLLTDPTFIERFKREAQTMAKLDHQHIATVYEVGEAEERVYIALYLAHGPNLGEALAERGRLAWEQTLALLRPICEALDYAHGRGVVHRDLKPSNILLDAERGPLLTDFGFARLMGDSSVSLSLSGGILGTPAYIAPEVWELDTSTPQADIYALGCIVYEMLTGDVLFAGKTPMQAMHAHDQGPRFPQEWPEAIPAGIEAVLRKALARDPAARYTSGSALWHALNDAQAQAQAARETAKQAAIAAQWREETEAAIAAGKWSAAKMAAARWLALVPEDKQAQAAQRRIEKQLAAASAAKTKSPTPLSGSDTMPAPGTGSVHKPSAKPISLKEWLWAHKALIGIVGIGLLLVLALSGVFSGGGRGTSVKFTETPTMVPTRTPQPTATRTATPTHTPQPTATLTSTPTRTPRPTTTFTMTPTYTPQPTVAPTATPTHTPKPPAVPTWTTTPLAPSRTPTATSEPIPTALQGNAANNGVVEISYLQVCADTCVLISNGQTYPQSYLSSSMWTFRVTNVSGVTLSLRAMFMGVDGVLIYPCGGEITLNNGDYLICDAPSSELQAGITTAQRNDGTTRFGISPEVQYSSGKLFTPYVVYFSP